MDRPPALQNGDEIRVIAPSRSGSILSDDVIATAQQRLEKMGFIVTFSKHWKSTYDPDSEQSIVARVQDLHEAFHDNKVKAIFTAIGGFTSNRLLSRLDFELIDSHPKVLCGFSDITVLLNAIWTKCNFVTYLGPHFSSWGMKVGFEYTQDAFKAALMERTGFFILPSETWSGDQWYLDQENRIFYPNKDGNTILRSGLATGNLIGGNISSFLKLLGTPYCPQLAGSVLILEQSEDNPRSDVFSAQLEAISLQPGFDKVQALLLGRFPTTSDMTLSKLKKILNSNKQIGSIPIIANVNVGHTTPINYFPIGAKCAITTSKQNCIQILES